MDSSARVVPGTPKLVALRRWSRGAIAIVVLAGLLALPAFANPYILYVVNLAFVHILLAAGLNVLIGYTGQLAFANAALFGIGAYIAGLLQVDYGAPFWIAACIGVAGTTIVGVVIALPALRLSGLYLAIVSVAFAYSCQWVFLNWQSVTHGAGGFPVPPIAFPLVPISTAAATYYLSLLVIVLLIAALMNVLRCRIGRAFVAVRENETAAGALGINLTKYKTIAFGISALFAGTAGVLFQALLGVVTPESYDIFNVVLQFCMVMVGGLGSLFGSVLGAVLITGFDELIREFRGFEEAGFGALILLSVLFMPKGVAGLITRWLPSCREPLRMRDREP
jgi:branched-chain amino acid transport system permease protein